MSRNAEVAVLERIAAVAAQFRAVTVRTVRAVDLLHRRSEHEFRVAASLLDSELRMLAKLRGQELPWPPPPRAVPGAHVAFEQHGQKYAGYIESIVEGGVAECVGVRTPTLSTEPIVTFCRWSAPVEDLRVLIT